MLTNDAASNWGHRDNILNKWHKKVNLGLATDNKRIALVQQFEGDYLKYYQPPTLSGSTLTMAGVISLGTLDNISVFWDETPRPMTPGELLGGPKSYGMGQEAGYIFPPPASGSTYTSLPPNTVVATKWATTQTGGFALQADISKILAGGPGVYTIIIWTKVGAEHKGISNYSLFIK